jgi:hypothetical protein
MGTVVERQAAQTPLRRGERGFLRVMGNPFLVEILGVNGKEVWVSFPGADYPLDGMGAELEFHAETGYLLFHTHVVRGPRRDGVVLERTESSEHRQHRRHWRIPTDTTVVLRPLHGQKQYTAIMDNLSAGGLLVRAYAEFPLSCVLDMQLPLDDGALHPMRGRVVFSEESGSFENSPRNRYGIHFAEVPPESRRALIWHLYRRMRKVYPQEVAAL